MDSLTSQSSSAASSQYGIHTGVWINWSRGRVLGATLTMSNSRGALAIAFTAFFISLVASCFWRIACLVFHRHYSTDEPRDTLHHQRQVVLRNSASATDGLWILLQLCWARYRSGSKKKDVLRVLLAIVFATFCVAGFVLASGYSSQISTAVGNQVLIDGSNCGFVDASGLTRKGMYHSEKLTNAANYARQCYASSDGTTSGVLDCTLFLSKNLNFTVDTSAPCPFREGVCRTNDRNLHLDTGYIHSNDHLGMNTPPEQSIRIRTSLHCAPLATKGYTSSREASPLNFTRYHYGNRAPTGNPPVEVDYTFEVEDLAAQYIEDYRPTSSQLTLSALISATFGGTQDMPNSNWNASTDLSRPDGDTLIVFLSGNGVLALEPINDPWYQLNRTGPEIGLLQSSGQFRAYMPQEAASPMGCVERFQICNPTECGPLSSLNDAFEYAAPLFGITEALSAVDSYDTLWKKYSEDRSATQFIWMSFLYYSYPMSTYQTMNLLGTQALDSRKRLQGSFQGSFQAPLPDDQWQADVTLWFKTTLASIQTSVVDVAYGTKDPDFAPDLARPTNAAQQNICNNQIINSTQYTSFSLLGLYLTYIIGALIIITSIVLERLLACCSRRRKGHDYSHLEWTAHDSLHLHRLAQETAGWGQWQKCTGAIPTTASPDQILGNLDTKDRDHTLLYLNTNTLPDKLTAGSKREEGTRKEEMICHEPEGPSVPDKFSNGSLIKRDTETTIVISAED